MAAEGRGSERAWGQLVLLGMLGLMILAVVGAKVGRWALVRPVVSPLDLAAALPISGNGWRSADVPLGATEGVETRTETLLRFDDYVFRQYRRRDQSMSVYLAYWGSGRMPKRQINTHIPDVCWRNAGMRMEEREDRFPLDWSDRSTLPGQWRRFSHHGQDVHVIFWHLVGGEPYAYGNLTFVEKVVKVLEEPFESGFTLNNEQLFIRISSPDPIEDLIGDPFVESILDAIGPFSVWSGGTHEADRETS